MALKDLVAQKAKLTEDAVEQIVRDFVRYDVDELEIHLMPPFAKLNTKAKVLVYMTALMGWPFVTDEHVETGAKPSDLGAAVGIPGGTLRPVLKDLKDRHLLSVKGGVYAVRAVSLEALRAEVEGAGEVADRPRRKRIAKAKAASSGTGSPGKSDNKGKKKGNGGSEPGKKFETWISEGFFDEPRTLRDAQDRFHEEGILVPRTSIPTYLLKGVRNGTLSRKKQDVNGKVVWVYSTK